MIDTDPAVDDVVTAFTLNGVIAKTAGKEIHAVATGHLVISGIRKERATVIAADKRVCAIRSNYERVINDITGRVVDTVVAEIKLDIRQTVIGLIKDRCSVNFTVTDPRQL